VFVIIKTLYKDRVNNFPLFDDDKPNDHIDFFNKNKDGCQPKYVHKNTQNTEKLLRNTTETKSNQNAMVIPIFPLLASSKKN